MMTNNGGVVGVSDHGGWAVFVTASADGTLLDRRRVELVDDDLPAIPHHHEAQLLPLDEGVALVERVRASAQRHAALALDGVAWVERERASAERDAARLLDAQAGTVPDMSGIALRARPTLPPTIAERITDYRSRNVADWVMYRNVLASAAEMRGWAVHWYDAKTVLDAASRTLRGENFDAYFLRMRKAVGPPWNGDHKLAMAAAIAAGSVE